MGEDLRERTGVLVIRVWVENHGDSIRVRITGRVDVHRDPETTVTVAGTQAARAIVDNWLKAFERGKRIRRPGSGQDGARPS